MITFERMQKQIKNQSVIFYNKNRKIVDLFFYSNILLYTYLWIKIINNLSL